ncbi:MULTISPECIES: hypothetical protein [unclassified Sphingopyxis]|uniref:hypothetical protein n=1 Tax=unclassified Sphingopyxis TaxID=2614943 RepID=UPI00128F10D9|nr:MULTISPECIES: hypothetical protein [unclassified Sphingopyxis]
MTHRLLSKPQARAGTFRPFRFAPRARLDASLTAGQGPPVRIAVNQFDITGIGFALPCDRLARCIASLATSASPIAVLHRRDRTKGNLSVVVDSAWSRVTVPVKDERSPQFFLQKNRFPHSPLRGGFAVLDRNGAPAPRDVVIDRLQRRTIMELAINARIAHLESAARSISRQIDRTEFFADMIDWNSMTIEDCRLISMQEDHLAETLAETEMELDFRYEQLCFTAH